MYLAVAEGAVLAERGRSTKAAAFRRGFTCLTDAIWQPAGQSLPRLER